MKMCICAGHDRGHTHPGSGVGQSELSRTGDQPAKQTRRHLAAPSTAQITQHSLGQHLPAAQRAQEEVCVPHGSTAGHKLWICFPNDNWCFIQHCCLKNISTVTFLCVGSAVDLQRRVQLLPSYRRTPP